MSIGLAILVIAIPLGLIFWLWLVVRGAERVQSNPRLAKRLHQGLGTVYAVSGLLAIIDVLRGAQPLESLIGLPICALLVWFWFRQARNIKVSPES